MAVRPSVLLRAPGDRPAVFAALLAWGVLVHKMAKADFATSVPSVAVTIGAFWLLARPRSLAAAGVMFAGIAGQVLIGFDLFGNHWPFLALLGLAWAVVVGSKVVRTPAGATVTDAVGASFEPVIRAGFAAMWIVVALHKLNSGFLTVPQSCAVALYTESRRLLPVLPDLATSVPGLLPPAVVAVEVAIAIGLVVRPLRPLAVGLGIVFHILSGAAVPSFGGVAYALYVPFIAAGTIDAAIGQVTTAVKRWPILVLGADVALIGMGAVAVGNGWRNLTGGPPLTELRSSGLLVVATGLALLVVYGSALILPSPGTGRAPRPSGPGWVSAAVVAIVVVIGIAPYLGLRTENSLSMFSNLRTEDGQWNHLVVPRQLKLFDLQDTTVRVVATDAEPIARVAGRLGLEVGEIRFVDADLARRLADVCSEPGRRVTMTIAGDGPDRTVADACRQPTLTEPAGLLWRRVLLFRPIPDDNRCQH